MDENIKQLIIKEDNKSSVELHEDAKNQLHWELKMYFNEDGKIEDFIDNVNKFKNAIEKDILRR